MTHGEYRRWKARRKRLIVAGLAAAAVAFLCFLGFLISAGIHLLINAPQAPAAPDRSTVTVTVTHTDGRSTERVQGFLFGIPGTAPTYVMTNGEFISKYSADMEASTISVKQNATGEVCEEIEVVQVSPASAKDLAILKLGAPFSQTEVRQALIFADPSVNSENTTATLAGTATVCNLSTRAVLDGANYEVYLTDLPFRSEYVGMPLLNSEEQVVGVISEASSEDDKCFAINNKEFSALLDETDIEWKESTKDTAGAKLHLIISLIFLCITGILLLLLYLLPKRRRTIYA